MPMNMLAAGLTVLLSGSWISFGLPLASLSFGTRLLVAVILSPLVMLLEFFIFRWLGLPFDQTTTAIFMLNLPALLLIYRHRRVISLPTWQSAITHTMLLSIPFIFVLGRYLDSQVRAWFGGHVWMQTDIIYMLANGQLIPEEPELANVQLVYPWFGHVLQAVVSALQDSSPAFSYPWTLLLWLVCICLIASRIVQALGGNLLAQAMSMIWLCFGVNVVGYYLQHLILGDAFDLTVWGDWRFSPWVSYFTGFNQMILALGMILGLILVLIHRWPRGLTAGPQTLAGLLLLGTGMIYPALFPVATVAVGAKILAMILDRVDGRQIIRLTIIMIAVGLFSIAVLMFFTESHVGGSQIHFSSPRGIAHKAVESVIVLLPLLAGLLLLGRKLWETQRSAMLVLILGGLTSTGLYVLFSVHHGANEYKFIHAAALFLFPFTPLALEPIMTRLAGKAWIGTTAIVIVLAAPMVHKFLVIYPWNTDHLPKLESHGFDLALHSNVRLAAMFDSIRESTPADCIIVLDRSVLHFPTLTRRSLYASPVEKNFKPGYNYPHNKVLLMLRGYDRELLESRRAHVQDLLGNDDSKRLSALRQIIELNRPVAVVLDLERHATALEWFSGDGTGAPLYEGDGHVVWLIPSVGSP